MSETALITEHQHLHRSEWGESWLAMPALAVRCGGSTDRLRATMVVAMKRRRIDEWRKHGKRIAPEHWDHRDTIDPESVRVRPETPALDDGHGSTELGLWVRGLSYQHIGAALNITPRLVKSRIYAARQRMKEAA